MPARFLQAESQLRSQFKGLRKLLTGLPRAEVHAPAWLDLTAKLVLSGGEEGKSMAGELAASPTPFAPGSREKALAAELLELSDAGADALEAKLAATRPGSRAEEVVLLFWNVRLDDGLAMGAAVESVRRLMVRFPDRQAVRRVYVARLTRLAIDLAGKEKYAEALRVVERCLELEPHETVHCQNRAALFTLLRENEAYHEAWFELDRRQYRLALLGRIHGADALAMAKTHWLFAQQARLPAAGSGSTGNRPELGFLMETIRTNEGCERDDPGREQRPDRRRPGSAPAVDPPPPRRANVHALGSGSGSAPVPARPGSLAGGAGTACESGIVCAVSRSARARGGAAASGAADRRMDAAGRPYRPRLHGAI